MRHVHVRQVIPVTSGDLEAGIARLRGLIARELQREFPGAIVRPLREGGWVAVYHGMPVTAADAVILRTQLASISGKQQPDEEQ